jgi:hypothetical protein
MKTIICPGLYRFTKLCHYNSRKDTNQRAVNNMCLVQKIKKYYNTKGFYSVGTLLSTSYFI